MAETRTAFVTGGNRGIGFAIARQLARDGVMVAIGCRDVDAGQKAVAELASEGLELPVVALDVTHSDSIRAAVLEVERLFQRVDILVNNAGVLLDDRETGAVDTVAPDVFGRTMATNVFGPLLLMQSVLPQMKAKGFGRIVNVSSGMGQLSEMGSGFTAYRVSKTALNGLTKTAAADVAAHGDIKINAMCPGWVKTRMGGEAATRSSEEGADTAVWLATLEADGPNGGFFRDRKPIAW